jgi:hypothetical protein
MRTVLLLGAFAAFVATGCTKTVVVNEGDEVEENDGEAHGDDSGDAWDGVRWVVVGRGHRHGPGCGHYHHHGAWHIHPAHHVHTGRHHHFKARVIRHHKKHH